MKKRNYTIIITVLIMVLIAVFLLVFLSNNKETTNRLEEEENKEQINILKPEEEVYEMEIVPEATGTPAVSEELVSYSFDDNEEVERMLNAEDLKRIAFAIAERFGSYSNQGKFGNINDLKIYMNEEMENWANNYVTKESEKEYSGEYYGITTTALAGKVSSFNDKDASILISTRRKEVSGTKENIFNQDIKINFKKIDSDWKVSGIYWEK